jgi:anthranilate synthase/aminodeoxychorismate synthase-like glutamine amidotransferase
VTRTVLLVDNYDSFSFNLAEAFERLGCKVLAFRNSAPAEGLLELALKRQALIALSPGPGKPADAGCCLELVRRAKGKAPLLGVCLGHQAIVEDAGGTVGPAPRIVHGKASLLEHDQTGMFEGLVSPLRVGRYHSLCTMDLPKRFHVHARLDGMAMAISDTKARQFGLQFHPESILTPHGDKILANILRLAEAA